MVSPFRVLIQITCTTLFIVWAASASAVTMIRDADIENSLKMLARPLISAAGLSPSRVKVIIINDRQMNAFVVDSKHVFINSGLLLRLDSAAELQSVLAHELAHIANGHLVTRRLNAGQMRNASGLGILVAIVAAAAGAGEGASGLALGISGSATGAFLAHTRAEEASADAAAVRYMARAKVDPRAALGVLENFQGQEALSTRRQDAYIRTHPLTSDRIRALQASAAGVAKFPPNANADYWFRRAQAKLSAFLVAPSTTLKKFKKSDRSDIAQMARAVAYHRTPNPQKALEHINKAIATRPNDPYLHDIKGQILLESRNFNGSVKAYQTANSLKQNQPQILAGLGRAYLSIKTANGNKNALAALQSSYARDPRDARMLRDLAVAYSRRGQTAMASLATAERYAMLGRTKDALLHATRAAGALPEGSTEWRRARDIIHAAKQAEKERKNG